jgi:hypothetical protein
MSPVYFYIDGWYFATEDNDQVGPFPSQDKAEEMYIVYCEKRELNEAEEE